MNNAAFWAITAQFILYRRHITSPLQSPAGESYVIYKVITAVTMKIAVLWSITLCGSCKN
jgi:short subunit fatty acids transporter